VDGKQPVASSPCSCHYAGRLIDGTEFDSSIKRGKPTTFAPNQVIKGWTEAMQLMREGDKWELTIPPQLGYGSSGAGNRIPGGAVLIFEMEILEVSDPQKMEVFGVDLAPFMDVKYLMAGVALIFFLFRAGSGGGASASGKKVSLAEASDPSNPRVFLDIQIGDEDAGRVELELFAKIAPRTAENFRCLCTGEKGKGRSGKQLTYKGSGFHRIIQGFMCQGGDFTAGNGTGGESIYGSKFEDEWTNGVIEHSVPNLLSMANAGPNTNGSQFFLTVARTPWLDGKHVVFGRVIKGEDVVKKMEAVGSSSGGTSKKVVVADCGELENAVEKNDDKKDN